MRPVQYTIDALSVEIAEAEYAEDAAEVERLERRLNDLLSGLADDDAFARSSANR